MRIKTLRVSIQKQRVLAPGQPVPMDCDNVIPTRLMVQLQSANDTGDHCTFGHGKLQFFHRKRIEQDALNRIARKRALVIERRAQPDT
jgi:hypothetical protein